VRKTRLVPILAAGALALAGCRAPGSGPPEDAGGGALPQELARRPERLKPEDRPSKSEEAADRKREGDGPGKEKPERPGKDPKGPEASPSATPSPAPADPEPDGPEQTRSLSEVSDARDDQGALGPSYADLVAVAVASRGDAALIFVDLAEAVPSRLEAGEVMGIGVDLYTGSSSESTYQLFADGGSDGWHAYLQGPDGFVAYPGSFAIGGRRLAFEVPWRSLGNVREAGFRAFADWSEEAIALNRSSNDLAPEDGSARFSR